MKLENELAERCDICGKYQTYLIGIQDKVICDDCYYQKDFNNKIEVKKDNIGWTIKVYEDNKIIKDVYADTGISAHDKARILYDYYGYTTLLKTEYNASSEKFVDTNRVLFVGNNL